MSEEAIMFMRLTNGEDIVGVLVGSEDGSLFVKDPHRVIYMPGAKKGSITLSLIEWVMPEIVSEEVFEIPAHQLITMAPISPAVNKYYQKAVETLKGIKENPDMQFPDKKVSSNEDNFVGDADLIDELSALGDFDYIKEALEEIQRKASDNKKRKLN